MPLPNHHQHAHQHAPAKPMNRNRGRQKTFHSDLLFVYIKTSFGRIIVRPNNCSAEQFFGRIIPRPNKCSAEKVFGRKLIWQTVLAGRYFSGKLCKPFNTRHGVNFYRSAEKTNIRPKNVKLFRPKNIVSSAERC